MRIHPFQALRPTPDKAALVSAVPYDVVDTEEARALTAHNPLSFLRVSRAEVDFAPGTDPHTAEVYTRARENFESLLRQGALVREAAPALYVYRQVMGSHAQRGVVACCHIEDYEANRILRHEKTRQDKEDDRVRHTEAIAAQPGPVFLMYRDRAEIDQRVRAVEEGPALFDFAAPDGVQHTVWRVAAPSALAQALGQIPACYVADGHHRAAAAVRVGAERRRKNSAHSGTEEYNWFLSVLFPASQLQVLPYNRCVADLNGLSETEFVRAVERVFAVKPAASAAPAAARRAGMYVGGRWYELSWEVPAEADPVSALDVSVLQDRLLGPILGIRDPKRDARIDFVGGIRGTGELVERVAAGRAAVAFSMHPVRVEQVMAVSDSGALMPPKSTWFEPKLRSGLLIHTL